MKCVIDERLCNVTMLVHKIGRSGSLFKMGMKKFNGWVEEFLQSSNPATSKKALGK